MRGISSFVRLALPAGAAWAIRSARCRAHVAAVSASALPPARKITLALCQVSVTDDKDENIRVANQAIRGAAAQGAELVVLPEMWNCPYSNDSFPSYAEDIDNDDSPSVAMLSETSKLLGVTVVGGSIPERSGDKLFNTCCVFAPDGRLLAKHRKVHLFDIDIPGGITFRESDTLTAGEGLTVVDTAAGRLGIGICYDLRFPEMATMYAAMGVQMLVYPGAFNMTTGPVHWQLLQQARAVDNQLFVCTCSPARNPDSSYQAWGHSMVVGPFGQIVATTGHEAGTVMVEVDLQEIEERRQNMPLSLQKRADIYRLTGEMPKVRS